VTGYHPFPVFALSGNPANKQTNASRNTTSLAEEKINQLKHLVEEPDKSHFSKVKKMRFKVSQVFQRATST